MSVGDYRCHARRGAADHVESTRDLELMFVRRGVFTAKVGSEEFVLTPAHALLLPADTSYRIDHPAEGGDDCTVFALSESVIDPIRSATSHTFDRPIRASFGTHSFVLHQQFYRDPDEENAWGIVSAFVDGSGHGPKVRRRMSARTRRAVLAAEELIGVHYVETLPLQTIAEVVGLSRFHLCRHFRAATGTSIHQFQTRLRLREALRRLDDGASDLAALALDLGFADHSHFSDAFQQHFAIAPSQFRWGQAFSFQFLHNRWRN